MGFSGTAVIFNPGDLFLQWRPIDVGYAHWAAAAARSVPASANSPNVRKTAKKPA